MAEEKKSPEYNAMNEAMNYGTIWTNSLFEQEGSTLKISRAGGLVNIRIAWSSILWGGLFGLISLGLAFLIFYQLLGGGLLVMPFAITMVGGSILGGVKLGRWSPLRRNTGEDLITYLILMARRRLARGGRNSKPSITLLNSKASGGTVGRIVRCEQWLGTQPLTHAPPRNPYVRDYRTEYDYKPSGEFKVVPSTHYHDGLGDRF